MSMAEIFLAYAAGYPPGPLDTSFQCTLRRSHHSYCHVPLEQLASRWVFGKFCAKHGHSSAQRGLFQIYRCYVIYAANHWFTAFPCLMYFASLGTCSNTARDDDDAFH